MKKEKGITLMALVVTIIVLLILAGVAIYFTVGQDGIVNRSKEAVQKHNQALGNELSDMKAVESAIDLYLGEGEQSGIQPNADQEIVTITTAIGAMQRQKANYLKISMEIEEEKSKAKLIIHPGIDAWAEVVKDEQDIFDKEKIEVQLVQKPETFSAPESSAGLFTHVVVKMAVKKDKTYNIASYAQGGNEPDTEGYKQWVQIGEAQTTLTQTAEIATTPDWGYVRMYDANGDGLRGLSDLIPMDNAIRGDTIPIPTKKGVKDTSYYYAEMLDEYGEIKKEFEIYIGFDSNRDGLIDTKDAKQVRAILLNEL